MLYCRYCRKVVPAEFDRVITAEKADIDINSLFDYLCTNCNHVHTFSGIDIIAEPHSEPIRDYAINKRFLIGEKLSHPSFEIPGLIVGKEPGRPSSIIVSFASRKGSIKKFVENFGG